MTKKLFNDEKAMRALTRALKLTEECHDDYDCSKCLFKSRGCKAIRVREAVSYVLEGNRVYTKDGAML